MRATNCKLSVPAIWVQLFVLLLPALSGCSYIPWPETFGEVSGTNATRSLNGLGVHRRMWESTGAKVLTPQKLSPRLDSIDTIVLVGRNYQPPGALARDWLEKWLSKKTGRTVVYFGRDFDANLMYREDTLDQVAPPQHERAETLLASIRAREYVNRNVQIPEGTFCRWFYLQTSAPPTVHDNFTGPWSSKLNGIKGKWPTGVLLEPPDETLKSKMPTWVTGAKPALAPARSFVKGADGEETLGEKEVQRSIWKSDELENAEEWDAEWELTGDVTNLLEGKNGTPLVHRIEHAKFRGSKILIVVNGAPFLNGSLIKPLHRKVGEMVIEECLPAKRVAMIEYDENGLLLSNIASGSETNFGVQLLTVWPLSAITMHAAFFGIIAFVVLLPILGRPQSLARRTVTDFGLHVEAMGRMMFESRDLIYGLKSIQDYFTKVRRETPPDWTNHMMGEEVAHQAALAAAKLKSSHSKNSNAVPPAIPPASTDVAQNEQIAASENPADQTVLASSTVNTNSSEETRSAAAPPEVPTTKPTNGTPPNPVS